MIFLISDFSRVHFICLNSHEDFKADVCNITRCNLGLSVECKNDTELKKKNVYTNLCVFDIVGLKLVVNLQQ